MLDFELKIERSNHPQRATAAWFLPGSNVTNWIETICCWEVDHSQLRIVVVPQSHSDQSPSGVLVFGAVIAELKNSEIPARPAIPFGCVHRNLYLPIDAEIVPTMTAGELDELLFDHNIYVWHPDRLCVAAEDEVLRVNDFLTPGMRIERDWDRAVPGFRFVDRMTSLQGTIDQDSDDVMANARDDIGDQADDILKKLPKPGDPASNDPRSAADKTGNALSSGFAKAILWGTKFSPGTADQRTWINALEDWASGKLEKISQKLEEMRYQELLRLQEMLDNDPDNGLRHALPMTGNGHRGIAPPSSHLGSNNVNFSLGGIAGGGAADFWDVPSEIRANLLRRYRELAEREIGLGRYRRAAYIYAELLGELNLAARTLQDGKFFREAAVLYKEKLGQTQAAAQCLERGGLLFEAIELYESLDNHEKAGDLYAHLELHEQMLDSYEKAAKKAFDRSDYIDAARIQETKMDDIESALETLHDGWESNSQTDACMREGFRLLGTNGMHDRSRYWLKEVTADRIDSTRENVVSLISNLATTYPDQSTRDLAAQSTRILVSRSIQERSTANLPELMSAVARLSPNDKLLRRDCNRFPSTQRPNKRIAPTRQPRSKINRRRVIKLPEAGRYTRAVKFGDCFVAAGTVAGRIHVVRGLFEKHEPVQKIVFDSDSRQTPVVLTASTRNRHIIVHPFGSSSLKHEYFPETTLIDSSAEVGGLGAIDSSTLSVAETEHGIWQIARVSEGELILDTSTSDGMVVGSRTLRNQFEISHLLATRCIVHHGNETYIAVGNELIVVSDKKRSRTITFDEPIASLAANTRSTRTRIAVGFEKGVRLLWDGDDALSSVVNTDIEMPNLVFTRTGHLIVASGNQCNVYQTRNEEVHFVGLIDIDSCVDLFRTNKSDQFAILTREAEIHVYQFPTV